MDAQKREGIRCYSCIHSGHYPVCSYMSLLYSIGGYRMKVFIIVAPHMSCLLAFVVLSSRQSKLIYHVSRRCTLLL